MKRIGIFGGTFNPVHHGHLINIELIKERFSLDLVLFIPAKIPVHKQISGPVEPSDRLRMVELAIDGYPGFSVSSIEIDRCSPSYTITTLEELKISYPCEELILIIGSDSFNELDTWREYEKIIYEYSLIVMLRNGNEVLRDDLFSAAKKVDIHRESMIEISSSIIRERVKQGLPIRYMTTDSVIEHIMAKGLYKIEQ